MEQTSFISSYNGKDFTGIYVTQADSALRMLKYLEDHNTLLGIDLETMPRPEYRHIPTAGLSPHLGMARLLTVADGEISVVFDLHFLKNSSDFCVALKNFLETNKFVAHYAKFDLGFFMSWGITKMDLNCSQLVAKTVFHALYHNDSGISYSLAGLSEGLFKQPLSKASQASDWSNENLLFEQIEYAALDSIVTLFIFNQLKNGLVKFNLIDYYNLIKAVQFPIVEMEIRGIGLDVKKHKELITEWRDTLWKKKKELMEITGLDRITNPAIAEWLEKNLDPELLIVWPRTEKEKLKTDSKTFAEFENLPIVAPLAAFKTREKLASTYGSNLVTQVNCKTGNIHTRYNISGARTGRLSSSQPNLQNIPRNSEIRENFLAPPGYIFIYGDYSQIELRVAAELSQDEAMLYAFREGLDLHQLTASEISGIPYDQVSKSDRQKAKAFNFGLLFGLGANSFSSYAKMSYGVDVPHEEALDSIRKWRELYSGYYAWQKEQAAYGETFQEVRTPVGKLRKLAADNTYGTSMNTPVQGGACEVLEYGLIYLYSALKIDNLDAFLVNTVHDEVLVASIPADLEKASENFIESMTSGFTKIFPSGVTRGLIDVGYGLNWQEAKRDSEAPPENKLHPVDFI